MSIDLSIIKTRQIHIVFILSNCSTAPYFNWFARAAQDDPRVKMSFINLHSERPAMIEEVGQFGCECIWIPFDLDRRKRHMMKVVPKITKALKKLKPDVFHSHLFDDSLPGLIAAKLAGVKVRAITKGDTGFHHFYSPKWVKFDRLNNRNATDIVAISSQCKDFILDHERGDAGKITLIHHGIPMKEMTNHLPEVQANLTDQYEMNGRYVIGTVARLIHWKGHHLIVEASERIVSEYPDTLFIFVGNGDERSNLEKQIADKGLQDHFRFVEWISPDQIPSMYGLFDLYLHAAQHEPFGFVIAEALANGVPVVSTSTGAARDSVIDGENGFLVNEGDSNALADAVLRLRTLDQGQLKQHAKRRGEELFTFERMYEDHISLYQRALSR